MPTQSLSPSAATTPLSSTTQNALYTALLTTRAIPTIQSTLAHELHASGWTTNLRAHIQSLLRSGECSTYNDVMARLVEEVLPSIKTENGYTNGVNGHGGGREGNGEVARSVEDGGIQVPERAVREGVRVVRRELEKVLDIPVEREGA